jgi:glycosyltransferase involved in cell wall biosynthesis
MSEPVRIAHVALQLETGGMERLLADFARYADRRRFDLRFVALTSRGRVADEIEAAGFPVEVLGARPGVRPALTFRLARLFRDQRIDLVHTHNTRPLVYAGPAARLAGVGGVVHTRHGQRHRATPRQNLLFRLAGRCADRVVCVSEDSRRLCRQEGIAPGAISTIWNGIDRNRFRLTGPTSGGPALFVGRLSPEKDIPTLLRATAVVVANQPSFRLQIAGSGRCIGELATLAGSLGLDDHVEFLGDVADVPGLLGRASLFVLPSVTEGLPITVLEAMACGLPVVATRVGGTPEAVAEGQSGLLVEPGEPEQLARALLKVWSDVELAKQMGIAGHRRVEEHFDVRTMVSKYESLYQDVLQSPMSMAA